MTSDDSLDHRSCLCSSGSPEALQAFPVERPVQDSLVIIAPAVVSQGEQNNDPGVKMIN